MTSDPFNRITSLASCSVDQKRLKYSSSLYSAECSSSAGMAAAAHVRLGEPRAQMARWKRSNLGSAVLFPGALHTLDITLMSLEGVDVVRAGGPPHIWAWSADSEENWNIPSRSLSTFFFFRPFYSASLLNHEGSDVQCSFLRHAVQLTWISLLGLWWAVSVGLSGFRQ